jgi:protein involved in polysaccharide export with SLBB domain
VFAAALSGCDRIGLNEYRWFNPTQMVDKPKRPAINPIMTSASLVDESEGILPNAEPPRPDDYILDKADYILGPTDVISISILDLYVDGAEAVLQREISETGLIDLPFLEYRLEAAGLTKEELKDKIIDAYKPEYLRDPRVSVSILARRNNSYSILGSVNQPGPYSIVRQDMRLLDALAMAQGVNRFDLEYIYVFRPLRTARTIATERAAERRIRRGGSGDLPDLPPLPEMVPPERRQRSDEGEDSSSAPPAPEPQPKPEPAPQTPQNGQEQRDLEDLIPGPQPGATPPSEEEPEDEIPSFSLASLSLSENGEGLSATSTSRANPEAQPKATWEYIEGRWVRVQRSEPAEPAEPGEPAAPAEPETTTPRAEPEPEPAPQPEPRTEPAPTPPAPRPEPRPQTQPEAADPYGWSEADRADNQRIIAINYKQLINGNPKYNILVRDGDVIQVPLVDVGEFYLLGEFARPGVYSLTGRQVTIKQALAAGGNLNGLAWPENAVLIRRIGTDKEQAIPLNLESIVQGQAQDIFLKPDDIVAVGSDWSAVPLAVLRNAFRLTYGFGFLYDRNFGSPAPGSFELDHRRFTQW